MTWSISFSYRLGLGFHALNNEGSDGSNLMQPRRIDVGRVAYDGISGEIVRRHILENFVRVCRVADIPLLAASEALHPDRGPLALREVAKNELKSEKLSKDNVFKAARAAVEKCALVDVGGYLAAFSAQEDRTEPIPESDLRNAIAAVETEEGKRPIPVKRDSVFDVGWLVSEEPQDMTVTQHAAYRPTGDQSLFSQTMRSNTYAGVVRVDLQRIGTDDYWYLHRKDDKTESREVVSPGEIRKRQLALIRAIIDFITAPTGAKTAGWAPHVFKTEGVVLLTSARTAPFASPLKIDLNDAERKPIRPDSSYRARVESLKNNSDTWVWSFDNMKDILDRYSGIENVLAGSAEDEKKNNKG